MLPSAYEFQSAVSDFREARRQAALQEIMARLQGKSIELLSYEDVYSKLRPIGRSERGLREIPLDAIVGSVGRYSEFTRTFLPRVDRDEQRWAKVKAAVDAQSIDALPPIEVYQIGEAYFVKDGNHRVSVARQAGLDSIHAHVIEVRTRVPLDPEVKPDDLIVKAEQAAFLEYTRLDESRPGCDLSASVPGQYARLEAHIEAHRYLAEEAQACELPLEEAAAAWYDEVYLPVARAIREQGILRYFPGRTETDLYVWITDNCLELQRALGWQVKPEEAVSRLAAQIKRRPEAEPRALELDATLPELALNRRPSGTWRQEKLIDRYSDRLFPDILVPISGKAHGWHALDQAIQLARRENATLRGMHVVSDGAEKRGDAARAIQAEFKQRCREAGAPGRLGVDTGSVAEQICRRAVMADVVGLDLDHPPASHPLGRLGSKFMTIMRQVARPVLAVPREASPLSHALLAYDDSGKAREALFIAAYLAERWHIQLTLLSVTDDGAASEPLDYARRYLEMHEVQAEYLHTGGQVAAQILKTATERDANVLIMGGYGAQPIRQVVLGGSVEQVLRESPWPVLVCR